MLNLLGLCECFQVSSDYLLHDDYESDADIPLVKQKEEEIVEVKLKKKTMHLISAICFKTVILLFASTQRLRRFCT